MQILPFSPIGVKTDVAATTAQTRTLMTPPTVITVPCNLRVVNDGTTSCLVAMGDVTVDATTDTFAEDIPPGERILSWKPSATYCSVAMRSGTGTVQIQLGAGV